MRHRPVTVMLWRTLIALALALVFISYLQPGLAVELGNRLWSCF